MEIIKSFCTLRLGEYNLIYELQYAKFIIDLFSDRLKFSVLKKKGGDPVLKIENVEEGLTGKKELTHNDFIYYIHVLIDKELNNYSLEVNGRIHDNQIKQNIYILSKENSNGINKSCIPDKYNGDNILLERYIFYLKIMNSFLTTKSVKDGKKINKIYGVPYEQISINNLKKEENEYKENLSKCSHLTEILESLVLVNNIKTLINNILIYLLSSD